MYYVDTVIRRMLKNVPDGGEDLWLGNVPSNVTITGLVATDAPYWIEVDASKVGQIVTTSTAATGARTVVIGQLSSSPKLLAAGGGYLYFSIQDNSPGRWHINAVPIPPQNP